MRCRQAKETKRGGTEQRKSEPLVRAVRSGNRRLRDPAEQRGGRVREPGDRKMSETQSSINIYTNIERIVELARKHPERVFNSIHHVIDMSWLQQAAQRVRKDAAVGVDGQTYADYEANLQDNLQGLLERLKTGTYRAPPVRRVHIPKADGSKRPIGIPTLEDKILQRAVAMVLEAIYEQDFKTCSYGFRLGRSAHDALKELWNSTMDLRGGYIIDADISDFFGTLDHGILRGFLDQRVTDGILRRVIHKWLKAGVLEDGAITHPKSGTPQGGVISPLLANVYLHVVLDEWFERDVLPRLQGRAQLIRYADDFVVVCEREDDARKVMEVLPKRFGRFGLTLHPDKTRLVRFVRPARPPGQKRHEDDPAPPQTFDFLGFTHRWGVSRKNRWFVERRTSKGRLTRALAAIRDWCRKQRHQPIRDQHLALVLKVRGHCGYYGIIGNARGIGCFHQNVLSAWRFWLDRRSQRARMTWAKFSRLMARYPLPCTMISPRNSRSFANP